MKSTYTRLAGAIAAALASGAAGFYVWPATHSATTLADRNAAMEVRTQVIHRTVHVTHHTRTKSAATQAVALSTGSTGKKGTHAGSTSAKTSSSVAAAGSSGVHALVTTRTSATGSSTTSGSAPVTTSTSPVGSGGDDGGSDGGGDD